MRLGLLPFTDYPTEPLIDACKSRDINIVMTDKLALSGNVAREEAHRLSRADCDGVTLLVGPETNAAWVAEAALHLHCPLLLVGPASPAWWQSAGALAEIGVPFDRLPLVDAERILGWLQRVEKRQRQSGIEAAHKLYGKRLSLPTGVTVTDPYLWQRQFGITLVAGENESADLTVTDGDLYASTAEELLRLITGESPQRLLLPTLPEADTTILQLARQRGRFVCFVGYSMASPEIFAARLLSPTLLTAQGDHREAVRAACETLDIEVVPLSPHTP
jgi:hypothetical protein